MDNAKKNCETRKTALENAIGCALIILGQEKPDIGELKGSFSRVERCKNRYLEASDTLLDKMLRTNVPDAEMVQEETLQSAIFGKTETVLSNLEDNISELKKSSKSREDEDISVTSNVSRSQGHHRLPKLELPKFGGEAKDWLAFWSAFKTVHDDDSITCAVKFQYLTSCMIPGSVAREIVASYPATPENYKEAIISLEERFGRTDMLVEVYVRDLIGLILENASKPSSSSSLYVKLSTQLRALGSLGVTTAKCAAILLPMVESALPEDILLAWQRCRPQVPDDKEKTSEIQLDKMMEFLKNEVEGSERIRLARQPFTSTNSTTRARSNNSVGAVAAAASLVATEEEDSCAFCGGRHPSEKCWKAKKMSLEERRKQVRQKRRCFTCLKAGHGSWNCKEKVECQRCGKSHYVVVCSGESEKSAKSDGATPEDETIDCCNQLHLPEVPLQTILLKIQSGNKSKIVRAMMDIGSQRSYVLKSTASELALQSIGERDTTHLTFGGGKYKQHHKRYEIQLAALGADFSLWINVDDEANICSNVPDVNPGKWIMELQRKGVILNDQKYKHSSSIIEVLLGNDVYGKLLTGKKVDCDCGITAIETVFGWTLSGEIPDDDVSLSCHVRDVSLQNLCNPDITGIQDGRPVSELPWIEKQALVTSFKEEDIEKDGPVRLHTRILPGEVVEDSSPIVLPAKDDLLISAEVQIPVQKKLWIIHCRRTIQAAIRLCVKSRKVRAQPVEVPKSSMPMNHSKAGPEFYVSGVDKVGPHNTWRKRFQKEFSELLESTGKSSESRKVTVGAAVLVGTYMGMRTDWPMGLVEEVLPEKDGQVLVIRVRDPSTCLDI